jgi:hypothetical protein
VPRTFPPTAAWSPTGHRIKALLDYSRGPETTWVYGALRVRDGKELTRLGRFAQLQELYREAFRH